MAAMSWSSLSLKSPVVGLDQYWSCCFPYSSEWLSKINNTGPPAALRRVDNHGDHENRGIYQFWLFLSNCFLSLILYLARLTFFLFPNSTKTTWFSKSYAEFPLLQEEVKSPFVLQYEFCQGVQEPAIYWGTFLEGSFGYSQIIILNGWYRNDNFLFKPCNTNLVLHNAGQIPYHTVELL